ncbi:MAG: hypothetical protein AAGD01_05530 [Acidobacteriota bacterium]
MSQDEPRCLLVLGLPEAVEKVGPEHPGLGGVMDYGTFAALEPPAPGSPWSESALRRALPELALERLDAASMPAAQLRAEAEEGLFRRPIALWVLDRSGAALFLVAGPTAPSLGRRPPCDVETSLRTLRWLQDELEEAEGTLFTEPEVSIDAGLDERMRQLYGE